MNRGFVLKIDDQTVDFSQPINLLELQDYEIIIDPIEEMKAAFHRQARDTVRSGLQKRKEAELQVQSQV